MEKSHLRWTTGAGLMLAPVLLAHPMQGCITPAWRESQAYQMSAASKSTS